MFACRRAKGLFTSCKFRRNHSMSGPIVRTGTTPEFWKNWDQVFGGKKKSSSSAAPKAAKKKAAKTAAAPKKAAKKSAKKAAKKK